MDNEKITNEISVLLEIRQVMRDRKIYDIADRLKSFIEKNYPIEILDTKNSVTFIWKR